jgi:beta-lactamase regulating signal transducer with metallopeptidase domain
MLSSWVAYTMLIGAAAVVLAFCGERLAAIWKVPRRLVWSMALVASIAVPIALIFRPAPAVDRGVVERLRFDPAGMTAASQTERQTVPKAPSGGAHPIAASGYIVAAWLLMSLVSFGGLAYGAVRLRRLRRAWRSRVVDGQRVFITDDDGPAVVGVLRPSIVLPDWAVALEPARRELMLRHEREHIEAHDPALLFTAAVVTALVPWNPALWVITRRLRLAVEIDCDARVLRATGAAREYGLLLLDVGARNALALPFAASLAERRSQLERRLVEMTSSRTSHPVVASLGFLAIATAASIATAQAPIPAPVTKPASVDREARVAQDIETTRTAAALARHRIDASIDTSIDTSAEAELRRRVMLADSVMAEARRDESARDVEQRAATNAAAVAATATPVVPEPAVRLRQLPLDTILAWIAERRPDIIRGNPDVTSVTLVIDADEHFVSMSATGAMQWINAYIPRDAIESVEVVKGPAAALAYGDAARNGVIMIRTKVPAATIEQIRTDSAAAARFGVISIGQANPTALAQPLIIVDGVQVSPENIPTSRIASPTIGIDVDPQRIEAIDVLHLAGGTIGPNPLGVVVVKLKRD